MSPPEADPASSPCTRESGHRAALSLVCEARQGLQPWARVRLEDLSEGGFRLHWPNDRIDPRQPLRLRVPGLQLMTAQIRWSDGRHLGCAFAAPLHVAVFEHIVRAAQSQGG